MNRRVFDPDACLHGPRSQTILLSSLHAAVAGCCDFVAMDYGSDLRALIRRQSKKFESGLNAGGVAHNSDGAQLPLTYAEINFDRFSNLQIALNQRAQAARGDIETDALRRP
jgi:hypothetical protein